MCYDGPECVENISTWSVCANCLMFYYSLIVHIEWICAVTMCTGMLDCFGVTQDEQKYKCVCVCAYSTSGLGV